MGVAVGVVAPVPQTQLVLVGHWALRHVPDTVSQKRSLLQLAFEPQVPPQELVPLDELDVVGVGVFEGEAGATVAVGVGEAPGTGVDVGVGEAPGTGVRVGVGDPAATTV